MAPISSIFVLTASVGVVSGYVAPSSFTGSSVLRNGPLAPNRVNTFLNENFGLDFAEDQVLNSDPLLLGEANYKQYAGTINKGALLNKQYNALRRIRELDLLGKTVDNGILANLEKNGVDLETIESLLPTLEKLGALSLVANNQQLLINLVAPLLIEPAPILLPLVAGALATGPPAFFLASLASFGSVYALNVNHAEIPFVGLPADVILGLLLVPLGVVFGGLGVALAGAKK